MARAIARDDNLRMPEVLELDRQQILAKYSLGKGVASNKRTATEPLKTDSGRALEEGANDLAFLRGLLAKEQLWRKHDFDTGYLMSRRELDLLTENDRKQFGRGMAYYLANSERGQTYFRYLVMLFMLDIVVTAMVVLATYLGLKPGPSPTSINYPIEEIQIFMAIFGFTAWVGSALLSSTFLSLAGSLPYGVRFGRSFFRLLTGWVSSNIRDYESYSERP